MEAEPWTGDVGAKSGAPVLPERLGKKWSGYHRRSLVETKKHGFKRLGKRVTARTFEPQVAALHVRAVLLNRFQIPVSIATAFGCEEIESRIRDVSNSDLRDDGCSN